MKIISAILLTFSVARGAVSTAPFTEPLAHPIDRYEAGWQKNPFTLKTAPKPPITDSFAKDLALAGWRGAGDGYIVHLVNTKTRAYSSLKNQEPGSDGTTVKTAHLEDRHADTFVELERNGETAVVRYDESFLKQMGAQQGAAAKPNPQASLRGGSQPSGVNGNPANQSQPAMAPKITPHPAFVSRVPDPQPPVNSAPTIQRRRLNTMPQPAPR